MKKKTLARTLSCLKIFSLLEHSKKTELLIFNYHRIYRPPLTSPFDKGVYEHSCEQLETQLEAISKYFDVLSESDLIECVEKSKLPSGRSALITFDDGYADNFTLARPILKSFNLPAIYFIPTKPIETRQVAWWDLVSYIIGKTTKQTLNIFDENLSVQSEADRLLAISKLLTIFKTTPAHKTDNLIQALSQACDVELPSIEEQSAQWMTWEQIKLLERDNIAIGSHSHSHRVLATLTDAEQEDELRISKSILEAKLDRKINSLSYPVGGYKHFNNTTKELAQKQGYKIAFSYNTGTNRDLQDPFNIKRFTLSNDINMMRGQMLLPSIFSKATA